MADGVHHDHSTRKDPHLAISDDLAAGEIAGSLALALKMTLLNTEVGATFEISVAGSK